MVTIVPTAKSEGMVMGMREKLIELIGQAQDCGCDVTDVVEMNYVENDVLADHLIANGVTIPVRCKDCDFRIFDDVCKEYYCNNAYGLNGAIEDNSFCSYGERRTDE